MRRFSAIGAGLVYGIWDFALSRCASTGTHAILGTAVMELWGGLLLLALFFLGGFWSNTPNPINLRGLFWALVGGTCLAIADTLYFYALEVLKLSNAGVTYAICEFAMIVVFGLLILRESISPVRIAGILCGGLTIVLLNWGR